jgi:hypothetical protein
MVVITEGTFGHEPFPSQLTNHSASGCNILRVKMEIESEKLLVWRQTGEEGAAQICAAP